MTTKAFPKTSSELVEMLKKYIEKYGIILGPLKYHVAVIEMTMKYMKDN